MNPRVKVRKGEGDRMATNSFIAKEERQPDGSLKYTGIFCHFDGDLKWNGALLKNYWCDQNKLNMLFDMGDISGLGKNIGEKHPFIYMTEEYTREQQIKWQSMVTAYHRDRGDPLKPARVFNSFSDLADYVCKDTFCDYLYIFSEKEQWQVGRVTRNDISLAALTDDAIKANSVPTETYYSIHITADQIENYLTQDQTQGRGRGR